MVHVNYKLLTEIHFVCVFEKEEIGIKFYEKLYMTFLYFELVSIDAYKEQIKSKRFSINNERDESELMICENMALACTILKMNHLNIVVTWVPGTNYYDMVRIVRFNAKIRSGINEVK